MRIGLLGVGATVEDIVAEARQAEADGFPSLWYSGVAAGDPLIAMAVAGRETARIELGTAVLPTYPCHPLLQANRVASAVGAMGRPGFTLGIGPSHEPVIRGIYGMSYDRPGGSTEEYAKVVGALLRGEAADFEGQDWIVRPSGLAVTPPHPVPLLLAALGPRLLRVAGEVADGTVLWMATPRSVEGHVAPRIHAAAAAAGRSAPRIVAGVLVAVHDDEDEARAAVAERSAPYAWLANYQRFIDIGGAATAADTAIVGSEAAVRAGLQAVLDAGATDILADVVPAGSDPAASRRRTTAFLRELTV